MKFLALPKNIKATETGLIIPKTVSFDEWKQLGETLKRIERASQWWIGDWLNAGERNYGEMYSQVLDESELNYQALANYKWVAKSIEFSTRVENVSWTIHRQIASLPKDKQIKALKLAEKEEWTVRESKSKIRQLLFGNKKTKRKTC